MMAPGTSATTTNTSRDGHLTSLLTRQETPTEWSTVAELPKKRRNTTKLYSTMDRSDLQAMLRFALQNNMMNKPFIKVFKWYNIQNSLAYNEHTKNTAL